MKKVISYIFRGWDDYENIHPALRIIPPIFMDLIKALIVLAVIKEIYFYLV